MVAASGFQTIPFFLFAILLVAVQLIAEGPIVQGLNAAAARARALDLLDLGGASTGLP